MSGIAFVVKCENILASLYVTRKRSRLTSAQSSVTELYTIRHSPLLLLTLGVIYAHITARISYKGALVKITFDQVNTSTGNSELLNF